MRRGVRMHGVGVAALAATAVLAATLAAPTAVFAQESFPPNKPGSTELVNKMNVPGDVSKGLFWNSKTVTFHGEAIGEVMVRGDHAWIHLNDDAYMMKNVEEGAELGGYNSGIAVWVPASLVGPIDTYGDYQHEGSIVEVEGVFNGACKEHGGDLDIHATSLKVLREGHVVVDPVPQWKVILAAALVVLAGLVFWLNHRYQNVIAPSRGL